MKFRDPRHPDHRVQIPFVQIPRQIEIKLFAFNNGEEIQRRAGDAELTRETAAKSGMPVEMRWEPGALLDVLRDLA
ncbi:hypothetical protein HQ447_19695 [bacterium]|nr:hypothetical protein [bacterium]